MSISVFPLKKIKTSSRASFEIQTNHSSLMKESRIINIDGIGLVLFEHSIRARRIIISVRPQKGIRVALSGRSSVNSALEFVHKKKKWIQKQLARIAEYENRNQSLAIAFAAIDRTEAKRTLIARLKQLAEKHGFSYNRVSLRNQQTRWGSCSRKNNISLNLKLVILPEEMMDYIILHELVHTRVHDHSKKFWAELDKYTGNSKALAVKLKSFDTRWI
jgi:predicted metal-dependent hydrolase